jgi:hypothetical protein
VRELAEKGDVRGVKAIGAMGFPEATQALLELAHHKVPTIASNAQEFLLERLPGSFSGRGACIAGRSWRPDLRSQAMRWGWALLANKNRETRRHGTEIIASFGGKEDLPKLIETMDKLLSALLKEYNAERQEWRGWETVPETLNDAAFDAAMTFDLSSHTAMEFEPLSNDAAMEFEPLSDGAAMEFESLSAAAENCITRGAKPPTAAKTPGEAVAFLAGLKTREDFRPPDWRQTVTSLLKHEIPYLRAKALLRVSLPLSDATAAQVAARIQDEYAPVQVSACKLAGKSKLALFRQPLISLMRTSDNVLVLQNAFEAARACGADLDRLLEILVGRLERHGSDKNEVLLELMIDAAIKDGDDHYCVRYEDWQSFLGDLQRAWREFIDANRRALREGKRFKVGHPPLRREMFPPGSQFTRPGQPPWPPWPE